MFKLPETLCQGTSLFFARQLPHDSSTQHSAPGASVTTPPRAHTRSGDQKQSSATGLSSHAFTKSKERTQSKSNVKWGGAKKASNFHEKVAVLTQDSISEAEEAPLFLELQVPWSVPKFSMQVKSSQQFSFFFFSMVFPGNCHFIEPIVLQQQLKTLQWHCS